MVFEARGVFYSPAGRDTVTSPQDPNNADVRREEFGKWFATDVPIIGDLGATVVRLPMVPGVDAMLGPVGRRMLDEFHRRGIMVVMTVDDGVNDMARVEQAVSYYKDHPAILAWSLGSEFNINRYFGVASTPLDAAERTERAAS